MSLAHSTNQQTYHCAQLTPDVQSEGRDVALSALPSASLVEANMIATNNGIDSKRSSHVDSARTNACTSNYSAHELGIRYFALLFSNYFGEAGSIFLPNF